jgi:hypothetical protein
MGAKQPVTAVIGSLMKKIGAVSVNRTDSHGKSSLL